MFRTLMMPVVLAAVLLMGCSDGSPVAGSGAPPLTGVSILPADGELNVRLDAVVTLTFARPVDRGVVEQGVHLISEQSMPDSLCPDGAMAPHGGMTGVMGDSSMMRHMAAVHGVRGVFSWNADTTRCVFRPDSMMSPTTTYMLHMGPAVMRMVRDRTGRMAGMGGHGSGMMQDDMMLHFVTMDTTGSGGGHGHH